jgi:hypothetical protein
MSDSIAGIVIPDTPLVLERFDPTFVRDNFVDTILGNTWPE